MLKKRIIPCLDIKDGRTVKGVNFENLIDAGDPIELARYYVSEGADELVFLDITATLENRKTLIELVEKIAQNINVPFAVGGGVREWKDAEALLKAGADKVSINSAAVKNPDLITQIADQFGSQSVILAVDAKFENNEWRVYINGGKVRTDLDVLKWIKRGVESGAGEILLTSMNHDGTKEGFAIDLLKQVTNEINVPVIASGGAGKMEDFKEVFLQTNVSAALAASVFHFNQIKIKDLKQFLKNYKIPVRWT